MADLKSQIARHRDALNDLQECIRTTFKLRDCSEKHWQAWSDACSEFHSFRSEVDDLLDQVSAEMLANHKPLREFVFDFISVDPIYFRSGYEKERILKLLKPLDFTEQERAVLHQTILRRVRNGALREFRRFCQLIPKIQTDDFLSELRCAEQSTDEDIRRRAAFALKYAVGQ